MNGKELLNHYRDKANSLYKKLSSLYGQTGQLHAGMTHPILAGEIERYRREYVETYKNYHLQKALLEDEKEKNKVVPIKDKL